MKADTHQITPSGIMAHAETPPSLAVEIEHEGVTYSGTIYANSAQSGPSSPQELFCEKTGKLLARVGRSGVDLHCKKCNKSHRIPWHVLSGLRFGVSVAHEPDESA